MDTNRQKVLQCIIDLHAARRPASRNVIAQILHEKLSTVDDAVKRLKEDGLVRTIVPGILEPVAQWGEDRPITVTALPDGRTKLEIGDEVLTLTPHEWQLIGTLGHGAAHQLATWVEERRVGEHLVQLQAHVRLLEKRLRDLQRTARRGGPHVQHDLFMEPGEARPRRPVQ